MNHEAVGNVGLQLDGEEAAGGAGPGQGEPVVAAKMVQHPTIRSSRAQPFRNRAGHLFSGFKAAAGGIESG